MIENHTTCTGVTYPSKIVLPQFTDKSRLARRKIRTYYTSSKGEKHSTLQCSRMGMTLPAVLRDVGLFRERRIAFLPLPRT